MSQTVLAKRYAKALYGLGHQRKMASVYHAQLSEVAKVLSQNETSAQFFSSTAISKSAKKEVLKGLFGQIKAESDVQAFLMLLVDKTRFSALPEIVKASQELFDADQGTTRGTLFSAQPLSDAAKTEYEKKASKILNKKILLETQIDPSLVGGVRLEVGGWTFDDSLQAHLEKISDKILNAGY